MPDSTEEAQQKIAMEQHAREVGEIIDLGRKEYGSATFDDASRTVADKLGERSAEFLAVARQYDFPHRIIERLGSNPDQLERLSKLSTPRMMTELARIEAQMPVHGSGRTQADPAWKTPSLRGRTSDADWKATFGADLSDAAWHKEFDRRQAERRRRW